MTYGEAMASMSMARLLMCGRFKLTATPEALNQLFPTLFDDVELQPRYNIAPTQNVLAVRQKKGDHDLEPVWLRWGLVPSWADDLKIGYRLINARADTVANKPAFRSAFQRRHCLILADGFYEWQAIGAKNKQPYHIHLPDNKPFAFAGLWECWQREGNKVESCTILTTDAAGPIRELHDRMPVTVPAERFGSWLDVAQSSAADLQSLLPPLHAAEWIAQPVSTRVNNVKNEDAACVAPNLTL
jgi:putative SOS response-associated peptidase YedK